MNVTSDNTLLHQPFMEAAIELAKEAAKRGEVPVGAVVVQNGEIIGRGSNGPIGDCDPTAHAEIIAIKDAAHALKNYRIPNTILYVTIEPCTMCLGAIVHARIGKVVYGAAEPKAGMLHSNSALLELGHFNHALEVEGGVLAESCSSLISEFFATRRKLKAQLKASTKS